MANTRKLGYGERMSSGLTGGTAKSRARSDAYRQIEGLSQNDQIIRLLIDQNELLRYIANTMHTFVTTQPGQQEAWAPPTVE